MTQDEVIDLTIQLQYFLVKSKEEMLELFNEAYNKIDEVSLTREETDEIFHKTVHSKEFQVKLDEEFEKEKQRNSGALHYAMFGT
jgi:phosphoribosyl-ATP pyrophosphohydrolase